jgi:putative spermidine/putrescine transport system ATP-binding protein
VNTVFQDYALFPHMNVRDNVAYGLMVKGMTAAPACAAPKRCWRWSSWTATATASPRNCRAASGSAWRLARALVNEPGCLLLDEPLGALDLKLREAMQDELKALQKRLGLTFVFVTHDQHEALSMADSLAVFNEGKIAQIGTPQDIYDRPAPALSRISWVFQRAAARGDARAGRPARWASLRPRRFA